MNKYKLLITGYSVKYFFSLIIRSKIKLYYIKEEKDKLTIIVDKSDYLKIKKIKTSCRIRVINRFGIEKIKYLVYKYRVLLLFFLLGLLFLLFLSNIIFDVEVVHPKESVRKLVYKDLERYGIKKYNFVISFSEKEDIKKKILNLERENLEWLEIKRIGTKYIVNVEERKKKSNIEDNNPRNIISKKSAMILEINSSKGEIKKKKYDYVKEGDILISGTILNKDKEVSKVKASGVVYGEVWYKVNVEIPIKYQEEELTGKTKRVLCFKFLNKNNCLELNKYQNYSFKDINIFKNNILPIKLVMEDKYEMKVTKNVYNINNIDEKALELGEEKFKKKDILFEKVLKKQKKNSKIIVDMFFKVKEDITAYQKILDLNLREDINE